MRSTCECEWNRWEDLALMWQVSLTGGGLRKNRYKRQTRLRLWKTGFTRLLAWASVTDPWTPGPTPAGTWALDLKKMAPSLAVLVLSPSDLDTMLLVSSVWVCR